KPHGNGQKRGQPEKRNLCSDIVDAPNGCDRHDLEKIERSQSPGGQPSRASRHRDRLAKGEFPISPNPAIIPFLNRNMGTTVDTPLLSRPAGREVSSLLRIASP